MLRLMAAAVLLVIPGAAMAQYYQPYQQQVQNAWQPPDPYRFTPQYRPQPICTTIYGRGAGGNVIANTICR